MAAFYRVSASVLSAEQCLRTQPAYGLKTGLYRRQRKLLLVTSTKPEKSCLAGDKKRTGEMLALIAISSRRLPMLCL